MARFRFRLDVLLKIARSQEDEAKKELALWQNRKREAEEQLFALETKEESTIREKAAQKKIQEILLYEGYLYRLREEIKRKKEEILFFTAKAERALDILMEKMKKRKILEKLKEKKREQYLWEQEMQEQKELDEIATKIYGR